MQRIAIRETSASDSEQILPLIEVYWQHEMIGGYDRARLRRQLEEFLATPAYGRGWVATSDGVAVGYLLCTFVYSFEHGGLMAEIDELFVAAEYRQQGIGRALLARARAALAACGCLWLQMQVADDNARAQQFYSRLGFGPKSGYRLWLTPLGSPAQWQTIDTQG